MRKAWLDYLRVIALMAVVIGHVGADFYRKYGEIGNADWWLSNILAATLRFAVPVFVMASGVVLLGRPYSLDEFYKKRAVRLIPPIIFWNLVYLGLYVLDGMDRQTILWTLKALIVINGHVAPHLWYLSMFVCLMLFVPFLNMFILGERPSPRDLGILAGLTAPFFLLNTISSYADNIYGLKMDWFKIFPWYMAYFFAGYSIDRYSEKIPLRNSAIVTAILVIVCINAWIGYYSVSVLGVMKDYFIINEMGIPVLLLSALVFLLAKRLSSRMVENKFITVVGQVGFGMYLIHEIFNGLFFKFLPDFFSHGLLYIPGVSILTFVLSFVSISLLRKIPLMRMVC